MKDIAGGMQWAMRELVENPGVGRRVRYVRVGEATQDVWTGKATYATTGQEVWGVFSPSEMKEEQRDGVLTRVERHQFTVSSERLGAEPTRRDRIVDGAVTYVVTGYERDAAGATYRISLRRLG